MLRLMESSNWLIVLLIVCHLRRKDLMDNLLEMMEKHTTNLESVIEERTHELSLEKVKTDRLLYNMMPVWVHFMIIIMIMSNSVNLQRSWTVYNNKIRNKIP